MSKRTSILSRITVDINRGARTRACSVGTHADANRSKRILTVLDAV